MDCHDPSSFSPRHRLKYRTILRNIVEIARSYEGVYITEDGVAQVLAQCKNL